MKILKIICLLFITSLPGLSYGQEAQRSFSDILESYYLQKDPDLLERTIGALNNPQIEYQRYKPILTGFFGALYSKDTAIKNKFNLNIGKINNNDFKELFNYLSSNNIDSIYAKTPLSPEYNDMNWASFFATGEVKYLDNIIASIPFADNRIDRNLYLTGASAKWSLCSNAKQDKLVRAHLSGIKVHKKVIKEILNKGPQEFRQDVADVIKAQRAKGLWLE